LVISEEHLREVCKAGQGAECCRYIVLGDALECSKGTPLGVLLDSRAKRGEILAQGDNCDGLAAPSNESAAGGEVKVKIIDQASKDTGIFPEDLRKYHCVNEFRNKFNMLCDGPCEACWNQEEREEGTNDSDVLATVTDEEAERREKFHLKMVEAMNLVKKAEEIMEEAQKEKKAWFVEMSEKYRVTENPICFDPKTKTLRRVERFGGIETLSKVIEMLAGGLRKSSKLGF